MKENLMKSTSRIDELVNRVQAIADSDARDCAIALVQEVMELHASALQRVLEVIDAAAPNVTELLGTDELVSPVLVLHGLHPDDFATRLARALDGLQRRFGEIQVFDPGPNIVHIQIVRRSRSLTRQVVEDAIYEAVPEIGELIVEGLNEQNRSGFVPVESLLASQPA